MRNSETRKNFARRACKAVSVLLAFPVMDMTTYWASLPAEAKTTLAETVGVSRAYLSQIACGFRQGSPRVAIAIEEATDGAVTREEIRPDVFGGPRRKR